MTSSSRRSACFLATSCSTAVCTSMVSITGEWSERLDVTISKSRGDVMWNIRRGRSCAISKKGVFVNVCIDKRSWLYQGSDTIPTIRTCPCKYTQSIDPSTTSHTGH
ncbi:hypothetical protein KCU68_g237, partial [Aureobasidium melanogenum]